MNLRTIFISLFVVSIIAYFISRRSASKEGFSGRYESCMSQGYSKEFCVQTPTSALGPNACQCEDGNLGTIMPGFGGNCVC